jgi:PAS domain-containing protein
VGLSFGASAFLMAALAGERISRSPSDLGLIAGADAVMTPRQHALGLPVRACDKRGVLLLTRAEGQQPFTVADATAVQHFASLGSAALALAITERAEREVDDTRRRIDEAHRTEQRAKRDYEVLRTLIDALPVCVTLHDLDGHLILANAAANQTRDADCLVARSPLDGFVGSDAGAIRMPPRRPSLRHRYSPRSKSVGPQEPALCSPGALSST